MKAFPRKNNLVAGWLAIVSAAGFAGAAYFAAISPRRGLMVLYIMLALAQAGVGVFLFKRARKSV